MGSREERDAKVTLGPNLGLTGIQNSYKTYGI